MRQLRCAGSDHLIIGRPWCRQAEQVGEHADPDVSSDRPAVASLAIPQITAAHRNAQVDRPGEHRPPGVSRADDVPGCFLVIAAGALGCGSRGADGGGLGRQVYEPPADCPAGVC